MNVKDEKDKKATSIAKICYILIGSLSFGLGALGAILPILPTTPFLLLSLFCFGKSSDKLTNWLLSTKIYQDNLESWIEKKGMPKKAKLRICTTVTLIMLFSFYMMKNVPVGRAALAIVWVIHIIFFLFFVKPAEQ
ncbi:MAG: YbaN family protein [Eubacteriales bacterium]